jgi:hypothetical protein
MEEAKKLFSQKAIAFATYFGGPAAAGYLVKKNYQAFNQEDKGRNAFFVGIISTLLIFAGIFSIPDHIFDKIPNALIPVIYTAIIYLIVEKLQGDLLKNHKESGGVFYNGWKAVGIGAVFMVALLVLIAGAAFVAGDLSEPDFDSVTYDTEIARFSENEKKSLEVFDGIDTAEPQYLIEEFSKGIVLWKVNKEILARLNTIEDLPPELLKQNEKLLKYCDLRIQQNEIIVKAIAEDSDKYVPEIERIGLGINTILEELK